MAQNIEIKATVAHPHFASTAQNLCDSEFQLHQIDTYYKKSSGRLKIREETRIQNNQHTSHAVIIYYKRNNQKGPKTSRYIKLSIPLPSVFKAILSLLYGVKNVVKKNRQVFLVGQTRIHLDQVDSLGTFCELEVVLTGNQTIEEGQATATHFMKALSIEPDHLISGSYTDLLNKESL